MKRISNKTKDILAIIGFLFVVFCIMLGLFCWVCSLFAEEISINEINKSYAEQTIVYEMQYQKMWEYTENMSEQEYKETFFNNSL